MTAPTGRPLDAPGPSDAGGPAADPPRDTGELLARLARFGQLTPPAAMSPGVAIDLLTDVPLILTARLGQAELTIGEILKLGPGATVGLDRTTAQPVELVVGGKVFARGEVVVVNDRFAVRIQELAGDGPAVGGAGR